MAFTRGQSFQQVPMNISGSSTFGRYPKISIEKTYNMFTSDEWLVPYAGYKIIIPASMLGDQTEGRGIFTSTKFDEMVIVIGFKVFLVNIEYNQRTGLPDFTQITDIGVLQTNSGVVYITENNRPQILISDNKYLYIYDPTLGSKLLIVPDLNFTPGYVTFHDTYFICAASNDMTYAPPANNTWRLSLHNQGYLDTTAEDPDDPVSAWPSDAAHVGLLQSKPDNVQAVVRFPSKGNLIFVMGSITTEAWFDTGAQLFPYQRNNQFNIDYGCIQPATVAYMDEIVVWLAQNEKSGPIIMYSRGGMPEKITSDGIDYLFSTLQFPESSQAFLYRQDGHLFYHINFYLDNFSLFYDFNTQKFYHASDQNLNYFIAAEICFFKNQYYFVTKNNGNLFAFDTEFTTYQDVPNAESSTPQIYQIPRIRTCRNVRLPTQDYFVANDLGFTIESGQDDPFQQTYATDSSDDMLLLNGNTFALLDGESFNLVSEVGLTLTDTPPSVWLSVSYDGGATFSPQWQQALPPQGYGRNKLMWWQCGVVNDMVPSFRFVGFGRFVCTDGIVNIRI
jgi:hypothetical protein